MEELRCEVEVCRKQLEELDSAIEEGFRLVNDSTPSGDERMETLHAKILDMKAREAKLATILAGFVARKKELRSGMPVLEKMNTEQALKDLRLLQHQDEDIGKRQKEGERLLVGAHERLAAMNDEMASLWWERKKELKATQHKRIRSRRTVNERLNALSHQIRFLEVQRNRENLLSKLNYY